MRELETDRLVLRAWREQDFPAFAAFCADAAASRFVGGALGPEDAWRKMASYIGHWHLRGYGPFALEEKASGRFVGYSGLWFPLGWPEREVNWGLVPGCQGRGYATEAAARVRRHAYEDLGWTTAVSVIANENTQSQRVAERLGAVRERATTNRGWDVALWRHPAPGQHRPN